MKMPTNGWVCYHCRLYASDAIKVVNQKNGDAIFLHRSCLLKILPVMPAPKRRAVKANQEALLSSLEASQTGGTASSLPWLCGGDARQPGRRSG